MPDENKDINAIVEEAFEAEEKAVEEVKPTEEAPVETPAVEEEPVAEEKSVESAEKTEEKPEEEAPVEEEVAAPKQIKREFVDGHWKDLDKDTKDEFSRLATENERNYLRAAEAEHNAKQMRKTLEPVQGYISEVAQQSNIPESEVIRNCVDIIQKLNDNPTLTARQMIAGGIIQFEDPVAVINEIAKTYGIDTKGDLKPRDIPNNYYNANAQARYEARQAKYVKPEEESVDTYVQDYVNNTPGIKALLDDPKISEKFLRQIQMERAADPNASDIAVINKAAEMFEYAIAPKAIPVEEPKPSLAEQKMAKVVSPTASNPVDSQPLKKEPMTVEQATREALRSLGLDD